MASIDVACIVYRAGPYSMADFSPYAVRRSSFMDLGMLDEGWGLGLNTPPPAL
jgi:hypothetical protein